MTIKLIHNPYSARWTSLKRQSQLISALQVAGIDYDLSVSDKPGDGISLANKATQEGFKTIIAAGGDGTIQEVINGILKKGIHPNLPKLGIMPMGTANDLMANLGMPTDLIKAAEIIAGGHTNQIDICQVNDRYFINNAGLGLEPYITTEQARIKYPRGILRYLLATFISIYQNPQWEAEIKWDDGERSGPTTMISIGNGPRTGGLFYTVPGADPFDGKLTFAHGAIQSRFEILKALLMVMKLDSGNYTEHPAVNQYHCTWMEVRIEPGTPAHSDGEIFSRDIRQLRYQIHPAALPILINK
jgi:diacylglycerol kinase (ATP)